MPKNARKKSQNPVTPKVVEIDIPDGPLKTNIKRMLQLKDDPSCCFDAAIWAHIGIVPKQLDSDEAFLEALDTHGFYQVKDGPPQLGDIICFTYGSSTRNPSMFGDRYIPTVRYQHAFIYLNETTVFQKNGGGRHCQFEMTDFDNPVHMYVPKMYFLIRHLGKMTISRAMEADKRILCYRRRQPDSNIPVESMDGCLVS